MLISLVQHLCQAATKYHIILEDMLYKLNLVTSLRMTEEKGSAFEKLVLSAGTTEVTLDL